MVSVIIPTYKGTENLIRAIESIRTQSYRDIEIIVVDDNGAGTEQQKNTEELLCEYINAQHIRYIPQPQNGGGSKARNTGARAAKGEYLMFLDDDDAVSPEKIEAQVNALQTAGSEYAMAYCSTKVYYNGTLSNTIIAKRSGNILYPYMMGSVYIGTGTALLRKSAWEAVGGYDETFVRHQDWEFFARVLNAYKAVATPTAYFERFIINRNLPSNTEVAEKYMDHYIAFLQTYAFDLAKAKRRSVINRNNARIALKYLKARNKDRFFETMRKYDKAPWAYGALLRFGIVCVWNALIGKKS